MSLISISVFLVLVAVGNSLPVIIIPEKEIHGTEQARSSAILTDDHDNDVIIFQDDTDKKNDDPSRRTVVMRDDHDCDVIIFRDDIDKKNNDPPRRDLIITNPVVIVPNSKLSKKENSLSWDENSHLTWDTEKTKKPCDRNAKFRAMGMGIIVNDGKYPSYPGLPPPPRFAPVYG